MEYKAWCDLEMSIYSRTESRYPSVSLERKAAHDTMHVLVRRTILESEESNPCRKMVVKLPKARSDYLMLGSFYRPAWHDPDEMPPSTQHS